MTGGTGGTGEVPGDDDSLEGWERDWSDPDDELAALGAGEEGEVPLDDEGRPLSGSGAIAPVWQRAIARLLDVFIVFNVAGLITVVVVSPAEGDSSVLTFIVVQTVFLACAGLYEGGMVAWRGQTLGKILLRLRVVRRSDGGRPTPGESAVRFFPWLWLFVPYVGQFRWIVIYLTAIPNARRQGWHDKAASTLVVVA